MKYAHTIVVALLLTILTGCEIFHSERKEIRTSYFPTQAELNALWSNDTQRISFTLYPSEGIPEKDQRWYPAQYEIIGLTHPSYLSYEVFDDEKTMVLYHMRRAQIPEDERNEIAHEFKEIAEVLESYTKQK